MPNALQRFERVAHRGAPRERLENTLPGFLLALKRGADAVELDVHVTSDGVPVVHHDATVKQHDISATSWQVLSGLALADDNRVPRLEDVLRSIGAAGTVYIELKGHAVDEAVIGVAKLHGHDYALHSFDHAAIERARARAPDIARGVLLDRGIKGPTRRLAEACRRVQPRDVWPHYSLVDEAFMAAADELGIRIIAWTVNETDMARRLVELGVAGICTDDVRILEKL